MPATAIRETFEEMGYPCRLLPLDMIARAPAATAQTKDAPEIVNVCEEPFMLTLRRTTGLRAVNGNKSNGNGSGTGSSEEDAGNGGVKFIWWFASVRTGADKVDATQTTVDGFEGAIFGHR